MMIGKPALLSYCIALLTIFGGFRGTLSTQVHSGSPAQHQEQNVRHNIEIRSPYDANYHDFLVGNKRVNEDNYFSFLTGEKKSHGPGGDASYWDFVNGDQWKKRASRMNHLNHMRKRRAADLKPQSLKHTIDRVETGSQMDSDYPALSDKRNMDWSEFVVGRRGVNKRFNYDDFIVG